MKLHFLLSGPVETPRLIRGQDEAMVCTAADLNIGHEDVVLRFITDAWEYQMEERAWEKVRALISNSEYFSSFVTDVWEGWRPKIFNFWFANRERDVLVFAKSQAEPEVWRPHHEREEVVVPQIILP